MKKLLTLALALVFSNSLQAQTYTQLQWGLDKTANPYNFGANINGTWSNLGTVTPAGVWGISSANISYTPAGTGAVTTTVQAKLRQTVSVIDFGADPTGVADSAPAFRNAIKSNRNIIIPPGTYTFRSVQSISSYCSLNLVCAINDPAVLVEDQSNFSISGYGATINVASNIAYSTAFLFLKANDYVVEGFKLNGNRSGMLTTQQNAGFALMSNVNWTIRDINFASGFDDLGSPFVGDWLVNGNITNNTLTNVGQCADLGYAINLNVSQNYSVGRATGNVAGPKCWSFINDPLNINTNNTGYAITQNDHINIESNYVTNFGVGAYMSAGINYSFSGNTWANNPGILPTSKGIGVYIDYKTGGVFPSVGFPIQNVIINGDTFYNNGATVGGAGVLIDPSAITNTDEIKNITITNSLFDNNNSLGTYTIGTAHASNFYVAGNTFSGAAQTIEIDNNTWALNTQFTGDNGGKYVTSSNPIFQTVNGGSDGGIELDNYSAANKWNWNVANSSGNFYLFDKTNSKFPFIVTPNVTTSMTIGASNVSTNKGVSLGSVGGTTGFASFLGSTSGTATIQAQAAAGTPTLTLPNSSGTFVASSSPPLAVNSATGNVSITGVAGQVLAGSPAVFTATPVLGVNATTTGSLGLANGGATGATVTVQNNGATSAYNFNLPATAGTSSYLLTSAAGGSSAMTWTSPTTTVNGTACTLGSTCAVTAAASSIPFPQTVSGTATSGGIPYFNSTTQMSSSALLAQYQLVIGGGAGNPPATLGATGSAGQHLQSGGSAANPSWTTATFPSTTTAGTILASGSADTVTATATPTLGVAGSTVGSLSFANATSGTVKLQPTTGALGTATATLPANTGTIAELNLAQTWTATQTFPLTNFTNTNAGADSVITQTNQPATSVWQQNVSNSNGNWYMYDQTSAKFPLVLGFNSSTSLTVNSNGANSSTRFTVTANLPTISTCGTTPPAATAGSSNNAGQFTLGTGTPTACTVTFNTAYANYAYCTVTPASNYTGAYYLSAQSKTAFTVTLGTGTDSVKFNYTCFGN